MNAVFTLFNFYNLNMYGKGKNSTLILLSAAVRNHIYFIQNLPPLFISRQKASGYNKNLVHKAAACLRKGELTVIKPIKEPHSITLEILKRRGEKQEERPF